MPSAKPKKWNPVMPAAQFERMKEVLAAPSPVGLEAAMTCGVIRPQVQKFMLRNWKIHQFKGNAGIVVDTHPGEDDRCSVMIIGHADKIRLQVRSIGEDGKIWVNSDSFLPCTLMGHEVQLFSEDPKKPGHYRVLDGGTVEALGAIHFADPQVISGQKGITKEMLYLELHVHGPKPREQVEKLGIRTGDTIILKRPIRRGFSADTFYGAYLDNGLGSFITMETARLVAGKGGLKNLRVMFAVAAYEEIGRFGSRVMAGELKPDVVIGVDVNHDYKAAPGIGGKRHNPQTMGAGFVLSAGSIVSEFLNAQVETACRKSGIPYQRGCDGRDTGTDAMAAVLASVDAAATSIGVPIRNMHTISEAGHTGDVLSCIHGLLATLDHLDRMNGGKGVRTDDFRTSHPRLDTAVPFKRRS